MTDWTPLTEDELTIMISDAVKGMEPRAICLWNLIRTPPSKWTLHPWGDQGGGFWAVAIVGMQVVWYNDIEDGFNVSRYTSSGVIGGYWCNQDKLQHTMNALLRQIDSGESFGKFGPPEPLT